VSKKLLSLRLCDHDSNFSYYDGNKLHYFKSERYNGIKHHGYSNLWEWEEEIYNLWKIKPHEIDDICLILDEFNYIKDDASHKSFFPSKPIRIRHEYFQGKDQLNHHYAHALSCWPITDKSDVDIVFDGFGEYDTTWSVFRNGELVDMGSRQTCGSVGLHMANVGINILKIQYGNGLDVAGKVMGLQSYGTYDHEFAKLINIYNIDKSNMLFDFNLWKDYCGDETIAEFTKLNWIRTVHEVVGDKLVEFFKKYVKPDEEVTYSGGVAQNVVWNTKLKKHFKNIIIPPHCTDDGLSLGGIEWLRKKHGLPKFNIPNFPFVVSDERSEEPSLNLIKTAAKFLSEGKIVGWYQGNGEIGPRALGNRSILCSPLLDNAKDLLNLVKNRENYRPFGASVLCEQANKIFEDCDKSEYMLHVFKTKETGIDSIKHVDGTCRIQTVDKTLPIYYNVINEFYKLTGCPMVINTSLNVSGKGIAGTRREALEVFYNTPLDVLCIGNTIYVKE